MLGKKLYSWAVALVFFCACKSVVSVEGENTNRNENDQEGHKLQ